MSQAIEAHSTHAAEHKALEELVVDNPDLEQLESLLEQFNIFEAIGAVRQELRHSDCLAFLLNPQGSHGLGDALVKRLLQRVLVSSGGFVASISPIDLDVWSLNQIIVQREWHNIDVLLTDDMNKLAVIVENKIDSTQHSDQLNRYWEDVAQHYKGWKIIGLYLTPDGDDPLNDQYVAVSYKLIGEIVQGLADNRKSTLGVDVQTLMLHYAQMLRRHIVSESEIAELCRRIYQKHQKALDLIYEHRPDQQAVTRSVLERLVQEETSRLVPDRMGKTGTAFTLRKWEVPVLKQGSGWTASGRILMFEFANSADLKLLLYIGPGPLAVAPIRQRLLDMAFENQPPFRTASRTLRTKWNRIYTRPFLTAHDYEEATAEEREAKIRQQWEKFLNEDLPRIENAIRVEELKAQPLEL